MGLDSLRYESWVNLSGTGFSPRKLQEISGLDLNIVIETGEIAKIGLYRGKPSPYGIANIKLEIDMMKSAETLNTLWSSLLKDKCGVEVVEIETLYN